LATELEPLFLREMQDEDEVADFVTRCVAWLAKEHKQRYDDLSKVFGGDARRLVEDIVFALSKNGVDRDGKVTHTYKLFVNGDPQRGKSNVEAVMARIVHFINDSPLVKDKCYSLLGSVMIGWAESLFANTRDLRADLEAFKKEAREKRGRNRDETAAEESSEDSSDSDDDPDEDYLEEAAPGEGALGGVSRAMRAELVLGNKKTPADKQAQLEVALSGGVLVFPRNMRALERVNELVQSVWRDAQAQPEATRILPVHFVFLDEADQMRGSTAEHRSETGASGRDLYQYEKQLMQLFGRTRYIGDPAEPLLLPALVVDVSATNQLSFLDLILRLHDPSRKLLDVLSFTDDPEGYAGLDKCMAYKDIVLADKQLVPLNKHVDEDVVSWYKDVISKPNACGLVVTTNRVTATNNMDDHFVDASARAVAALTKEGKTTTHLGVVVHGGEKRYGGCMGIYLGGSGREIMLHRINKELRTLELPPVAVSTGKYAELCAKDLRPLLEKLDRDSYERSLQPGREPYKPQLALTPEQQAKGAKPRKLSCVQLALLLTLLRRLFPATPIFIVGHGMVRRSLSLVGVDYLKGDAKTTTLVVTHMCIWATQAANGASVIQQCGRSCTTLVEFHNREGNAMFKTVQLLAPQLVWDYIRGGLAFNCWFGRTAPGVSAKEARNKIVQDVADAERCWTQNGGNSVGFAEAIAAHLQMPDEVRRSLATRGAVPPNAAQHIKNFRDHMATLQQRNSRFGVIVVRQNLSPLIAETGLRLLFRTVAVGEEPTDTEWQLGELPFKSREEHDLAKHGAALDLARVVNAYLAREEHATAYWKDVQRLCKDAFEECREEAQPSEGSSGYTVDATRALARSLERRLLDAEDDELPAAPLAE
jgi:hypothetical protein